MAAIPISNTCSTMAAPCTSDPKVTMGAFVVASGTCPNAPRAADRCSSAWKIPRCPTLPEAPWRWSYVARSAFVLARHVATTSCRSLSKYSAPWLKSKLFKCTLTILNLKKKRSCVYLVVFDGKGFDAERVGFPVLFLRLSRASWKGLLHNITCSVVWMTIVMM